MIFKYHKNYKWLLILLIFFESQAKSQSFPYLHWEDEHNPWSAEIVKLFNPPTSPPFSSTNLINPVIWVKHTRWGHSQTTPNIDYIADDGREWQAVIQVMGPTADSIVRPQFYHFWRYHSNSGFFDTMMLVKGNSNGAVYKIVLEKMTIQDYRSRTLPVKYKITLVSAGTNPPPPQPPSTSCLPEPDRILCPGNAVPANWVIIKREPCISCNGGSTCRQSRIIDLRCRPRGFEVKVCPYTGYVIPPEYDQVGTEPCGGSCADYPGQACVMIIYRKR